MRILKIENVSIKLIIKINVCIPGPYSNPSSDISGLNCDDEEDCVAGSGSGLGPPSFDHGNGGDTSYEPVPGNEESEEFSYPAGNSESGKCML